MNLTLDAIWQPSMRQPVYARRGIVAATQPLATQAGVNVLRKGGNAVDAAIATAVTYTVVSPCQNGVGGDMFALVWDGTQLHGLNASGRAPGGLALDALLQYDSMPAKGWPAVTVPGAPAGWRDLHARFGRLPFATLFEDAIHYAGEGFPVTNLIALQWRYAVNVIHPALRGPEFAGFLPEYAPDGRTPNVGDIRRSPALARTLQQIADTHAEAFYRGDIAGRIADFARRTGGYFTPDDFANHTSTWVEPIGTSYRGYDVWEIPPPGQGLTALIALNILEGFDLPALSYQSAERYHLEIEAVKLAFADAQAYIADMDHADVPLEGLLSKEYAAARRTLIGRDALKPTAGDPPHGDTVYCSIVDGDGMMVSLIQSTYAGFGSHVVVPDTGINLQNRGAGFVLDPAHPNCFAPGKRPFHTIIPGFLTKDGQAIGPFGNMGGHMQPQGHVQLLVNTIDFGMNPQVAIDQPRFYWGKGRWVQVEPRVPPAVVGELAARGHDIHVDDEVDFVGAAQIIWRLPNGAYVAGSESRSDGQAIGF